MNISDEKAHIREECLRLRRSFSEGDVCVRSLLICERIEKTSMSFVSELFYYPVNSEVDLLSLVSRRLKENKKVLFPKVVGKNKMKSFFVTEMEDLELGSFGILEPKEGLCEGVPDLAYIPGVAFSRSGKRIGYGKGFYDFFLSAYPEIFRVGVCYDFQLFEELPSEDFDCGMDMIVTEKETLFISERSLVFKCN